MASHLPSLVGALQCCFVHSVCVCCVYVCIVCVLYVYGVYVCICMCTVCGVCLWCVCMYVFCVCGICLWCVCVYVSKHVLSSLLAILVTGSLHVIVPQPKSHCSLPQRAEHGSQGPLEVGHVAGRQGPLCLWEYEHQRNLTEFLKAAPHPLAPH